MKRLVTYRKLNIYWHEMDTIKVVSSDLRTAEVEAGDYIELEKKLNEHKLAFNEIISIQQIMN